MVIAQVSTSQSFHKTHRYTALRQREVAPKLLYSSLPEVTPLASGEAFPPEVPLRLADSMEAQARKSTRVEKPCYHLALSVGEDERLSKFEWYQLATGFLDKAGLRVGKYQSVAYLHEDTQFPDSEQVRPHVHLVVNRVGADGRAASTSWDYYRFQNALREVEAEMGLRPESNSWEVDQRRDTPGQVHRRQGESDADLSARALLQQAVDSELEGAASFEAVVKQLEESGTDVRASDRGWSLAKDGVAFAGYQLGRQYTRPAIERRLAEEVEEAIDEPETEHRLLEAEDLAITAQGREMVQNLQQLALKQFSRPNGGSVQWEANLAGGDSETYDFAISTPTDRSQVISGNDSRGRSVFQATIEPDGEIRTTLLEIPAEQTEQLASKARESEQSKQRRARRTRQPKQAELEL